MKYLVILLLSGVFYHATSQVKNPRHKIELDTALSWKYIQSGEKKYSSNDYEGALVDFKMAITNNSHSGKAFRLKGNSERKLEQYDSAIISYTKAIAINDLDAMSYLGRAESHRFKNNCLNALNDYNKTIELNPKNIDAYFGRGCCDYNLDMHDQCISDFTKYLDKRPNSSLAHFFRGVSYSLTDKNHEAIKDLSKYLREQKANAIPVAHYFRGASYTSVSDENIANADSAIADLRKYLEEVPNHPSSYKFLGLAYSIKNDSLMAKKYFKQAALLKPDDGQIYYNWANLELSVGNYSKAVELYNEALSKVAITQMNDLYCQLGLAKIGLKDTLGALSDFDKSVQIDSNYLKVYQKRLSLIGNIPKYSRIAIHDLTRMIWLRGILNPEDTISVSYLYSQRGLIHLRAGNIEAARTDEDKAVSLTPKYAYSYLMRVFVALLLNPKNESDLLRDVEKAISLDKQRWDSYFLKALVMDHFGDKGKEKCECIRKAITLGGEVSKEVEDYYCKGKHSKDANGTFSFMILPHPKTVEVKR
jgi:tetratricopeptide (TPR) repeat protein